MTKNIYIEPKSPKAVAYAAAWPAQLLSKWDESIGGPLPTIEQIETALAVMSRPGGKPAVLNQGLAALVLAFRECGSTDGQRAYASGFNSPHNNVGKLGDALRSQYKTSRLDIGKPTPVTLAGGVVVATSNKSGHIALTVEKLFDKPAEAPAKPVKAKKAKKQVKAAATETPAEPTPDSVSEGDSMVQQLATCNMA